MEDELENDFRKIACDLRREIKRYPWQDQKAVADWLDCVGGRKLPADDQISRNDFGRYLLYILQSGQNLPEELGGSGSGTECYQDPEECPSTSTEKYSAVDMLANLTPRTDMSGICDVIRQVQEGSITSGAEFIFSIAPFVSDRGALFREILERELTLFREIVDDTIDRRVQDEGDVMTHTQKNIKRQFRSLTEAMIQRTIEVRQRLYEIAPKFDWVKDGKDEAKMSRLIAVKRKEMSRDPQRSDKLMHEIFIRGQWLKKEMALLQAENQYLEKFLEKFQALACERRSEDARLPRLLYKEKNALQSELDHYRGLHNRNMEIIDNLYLQRQRCSKPGAEFSDG